MKTSHGYQIISPENLFSLTELPISDNEQQAERWQLLTEYTGAMYIMVTLY
jgi:hypothetical protein